MKARSLHRAFSLRELTTVTAVATLAAALFVPLAVKAGGESRMCVCMSRLKSISMSTARYGLDHRDRLAALEGRPGQTVTYPSPGLNQRISYTNNQIGDRDSAGDQAIDILKRRGDRPDLSRVQGWIASDNFAHLALVEYDQEPLPSARWACPEDSILLTWQSDPQNFNNLGVPSPPGPGFLDNASKRWPYISNYLRGTYTWSADRPSKGTAASYFFSATMTSGLGGFTPGQSNYGQRSLSDVAFPSAKVYLWDRGARHFTPTAVYWNFAEAKQPMLYFDGATRTTRTGGTERGWDWQQPDQQSRFWDYEYSVFLQNDRWQPGFPGGSPIGRSLFTAAHFATTREGLRGRDLPSTGPQ